MLDIPVVVCRNQDGRVPLVVGQVVKIRLELGGAYLVACVGTNEVTRVPKKYVRQVNSSEMAKWSNQ